MYVPPGPDTIATINADVRAWLDAHGRYAWARMLQEIDLRGMTRDDAARVLRGVQP